jgi:tRNA(Ile)-lysidine synthase
VRFEAEFAQRLLDDRLECALARPLAVAFSGGGDSLALLLTAKAWADRVGRPIIALTVDHGLQARSGGWAKWCAKRAAKIGVAHRTLVWEGPKPTRGLPAAARGARHSLIAEAVRSQGARVVLFGHTADDVVESQLMQQAGVRISPPTSWSPSPVWPDGRGQFILRPLIGARRADIRNWLAAKGETWIDDPANSDERHPRVRARARAAGILVDGSVAVAHEPRSYARSGPSGDIVLHAASANTGRTEFLRWLAVAVACTAGSEHLPRRDALERLADRMDRDEIKNATLGGARIVSTPDGFIFARETNDARGRACQPMPLQPGGQQIWDGRFEVRAFEPGLTLTALSGHAAGLNAALRRQLIRQHPVVRAALPAVLDSAGGVTCPTLKPDPRVEIRSLVPGRLFGAIGVIDSEASIGLYS